LHRGDVIEPETKTKVVAAACVLGILAGAGLAWERHQSAAQARAELASVRSDLSQAQLDLRRTREERDTLHRASTEQKLQLQQMQAEMTHARSFVEAEKAVSARLRDEIVKIKEEFAKGGKPRPGQPRTTAISPRPLSTGR
jgi:septal ring factor EnvC (AmiA/AmiB activator)